ncbi:MAG: cytochrome P450 [Acidimicrobiales bacterium]|nr:cytochrome P450 [Acidimicrobiales bacterium]MCB1260339.1 cytochrome P450 [Acidimicrobiales bacterium]
MGTSGGDQAVLDPRDLVDGSVLEEPTAWFHRLLDTAPVWRVPGRDLVVVSSFDTVTEAVRRPDDFSSNIRSVIYRDDDGWPALVSLGFDDGASSIDVLATADPPMHKGHRSMVLHELIAAKVAALRPTIEALARARVADAVAAGSFDAMAAIANPIPIRVVSRLVGFVDDDPDDLLAAAFDSTALLAATQPVEVALEAMARAAAILDWIGAEVDRAIADGADGILDLAAQAVRAGELDRDSAVVMMHTLLSAGGESTTSLLGNAMWALANDRPLQDRLRADRELLPAFLEEVLRLDSPFRYHLRYARQATVLDGVEVPAGAVVVLLWAAANRDPRRFEDPDDLRLDRAFPRDHVGFGRGIHLCVGAPLARLEAEIVLGALIDATTSIEPGDLPPERVNSLMIRRFETLPLTIVP